MQLPVLLVSVALSITTVTLQLSAIRVPSDLFLLQAQLSARPVLLVKLITIVTRPLPVKCVHQAHTVPVGRPTVHCAIQDIILIR